MKFEVLDKEEFSNFFEESDLSNFLQSPKMDSVSILSKKFPVYVGVKKNNKLVAASRLTYRQAKFGKREYYAPRGLLVDYNDYDLLKFFVMELKKYVKKNNGYTLHIDPLVIYKERDINGDIVKDGINNENIVNNLKKLGFHHNGFIRYYDYSRQIRWSFELPLENKDEKTIMKEMSGNTRRAINRATHLKVKVRELKYAELDLFKNITDSTSERRSFTDKSFEYYQEMYKAFHDSGEVKYMIAEVDVDESIEVLNKDKEDLEKSRDQAISHKKTGKAKELDSQIKDIDKRIKEFEDIIKEKGKHLYLAGAMFIIEKRDIIYLFSGNFKEYMNFFGQYLIQWEMIKLAIKLKKECYNFYGIKGVFDKNDPDYGVYLFKKGFNGHVIEYIGDFYLPVSLLYYGFELKDKIKKIKASKS